jgi:hypothetical protein
MFFYSLGVLTLIARTEDPTLNYYEAAWFLFVTTSSVGYGDLLPETTVLHFITLWACVLGQVLVARSFAMAIRYLEHTEP